MKVTKKQDREQQVRAAEAQARAEQEQQVATNPAEREVWVSAKEILDIRARFASAEADLQLYVMNWLDGEPLTVEDAADVREMVEFVQADLREASELVAELVSR
jgi:hypothetical protein